MSNDDNTLLAGSSPAKRTNFPQENEQVSASDTTPTHETPESAEKVRLPKLVKHRGKHYVTIYAKSEHHGYRIAWRVNAKRKMLSFETYSAAIKYSEDLAKELHNGSTTTALSPAQARDALAALERLQAHYQATGKQVTLLRGISDYCDNISRLKDQHSLDDAITGFLRGVASVKRKDVSEAVEEFIASEEPRTQAKPGERPQLSPKFHYNRSIQLRRFAGTFQNTAVCELKKELLDTFVSSLSGFSAKSRNHYRANVRDFLRWSVRKDYLSVDHRLNEATQMDNEKANTAKTLFYSPKEFRALLDHAEGPMQAMIALGGLAGLRTAELLRLDWAEVWSIPKHIEITVEKNKNRQRRLVEVCPALNQWLKPYRTFETGKLWTFHEITFHEQFLELCERAKVTRKTNGLRHAFCTYHFALHQNEHKTAAQAGNSPTMVHAHYKGLATKTEGQKWFDVRPTKVANVIPLAAAQ